MNELVVLVTIDGKRVAIHAPEVQSVIELELIYPVPGAPYYVAGLTAINSQTITVIDCHQAIHLKPSPSPSPNPAERCPIIMCDDHLYALLVDAVDDVVAATSDCTAIPGGYGAEWKRFAQGMVETETGPALLIDPRPLVCGPVANAA